MKTKLSKKNRKLINNNTKIKTQKKFIKNCNKYTKRNNNQLKVLKGGTNKLIDNYSYDENNPFETLINSFNNIYSQNRYAKYVRIHKFSELLMLISNSEPEIKNFLPNFQKYLVEMINTPELLPRKRIDFPPLPSPRLRLVCPKNSTNDNNDNLPLQEIPLYAPLSQYFDIFLFDFDNTVTKGCVSTQNYHPECQSPQELTMDFLNTLNTHDNIETFVSKLFGLERGRLFAQFVTKLIKDNKKVALVISNDSSIVDKCLKLLFAYLNDEFDKDGNLKELKEELKEDLSKKKYTNPFFDPYKRYNKEIYKNIDYEKIMTPKYSTTQSTEKKIFRQTKMEMTVVNNTFANISDGSEEQNGNGIIYDNGVILSTMPTENMEKDFLKLIKDRKIQKQNEPLSPLQLSNHERDNYRKNKLIRRLVFDLSGLSKLFGSSGSIKYDVELLKKAFMFRTIFFDDSSTNIELLSSLEREKNEIPDGEFLQFVSGIKLLSQPKSKMEALSSCEDSKLGFSKFAIDKVLAGVQSLSLNGNIPNVPNMLTLLLPSLEMNNNSTEVLQQYTTFFKTYEQKSLLDSRLVIGDSSEI